MKKILLVLVLIGIVYFIGGNISNSLNNRGNAAQAFAGGTTDTQITELKGVKLATKNGKVVLTGSVKVKAKSPINVTFKYPTVFKDGQPHTVATSSFTGSVLRLTTPRLGVGVATNGQTVQVKKGTNTYSVYWVLNESSLTPGIYTMNLTGYTVGTTTASTTPTVYPLTIMSDTTIIRPTATPAATTDTLANTAYRLSTVRGTTVPASSTVDIGFTKNALAIKSCNTLGAQYKLNNSRISVQKLSSTRMACGVVNGMDYTALEKTFVTLFKEQPLVFVSGDVLTLSSPSAGVLTFKKISAIGAPLANTPAKVYPCNFIGPLEANATRDCSSLLASSTATNTPTLSGITPAVGSVGTTITLTGTNFAESGNIILMDNLNVAGGGLPAAVASSTNNKTTITFTVPSAHICPQTSNVQVACLSPNVALGTYHVQVYTSAGTSNVVSFILN